MKRVFISATLLICSSCTLAYSNLTEKLATARAKQVGDVDYQLSIELDKGRETFKGTNLVSFELNASDEDVVLDFDGKAVKEVLVNGRSSDGYEFDEHDESIIIPKGLLKKGRNTLSIEFIGRFSHNGSGLHQYVDPQDGNEYLFTDFQPDNAHRLFPHFDQPTIKASFTLDVVAPADWHVISNMPETRVTQKDDFKHSYFAKSQKMSSYIMHLSAGPYAMWQDSTGKYPMRLFARQSLAQYVDADMVFATIDNGFGQFEAYFDYPYPFTKYDQLFVPEFNAGAMENAGAVTISERYIFRQKPTASKQARFKATLMHELAHMWFGNLVTMAWWNDLWLNESFATLMGYQGLDGLGDNNAQAQTAGRKRWAYQEDQLVTTHPILADIPDVLAASANFDGITYAKGLAVLQQLKFYISEETFEKGIRIYFKRHAFGNTKLDDFIAAMEQAHGSDLSDWVEQWLATKDVNSMQLSYEIKNGKLQGVTAHQMPGQHDKTLRRHASYVGLFDLENGQLVLKDKVKIAYEGAQTPLTALNGRKAPDFILPNYLDKDYVKVRFDTRSMQWLMANMDKVQDDKIKGLVWRTLWDMVKDREMKTEDFYQLAMRQLKVESDAAFADSLSSNVGSIIDRYTADVQSRNLKRAQAHQLAKSRLSEVPKGSDLQRVWYDNLVSSASTPAHYRYLAQLFDGEASIAGIEMNTQNKWELLSQLAYADQANLVAPRMKLLLAEDTSSMGKNMALMIAAAYPQAQSKAQAWQNITQNTELSLLQKRYIGDGMYNVDYPQLAKPYIARYFETIDAIVKANVPYDNAAYFIRSMFPELGMEQTVEAAEQFLKTSKAPKTYRRMVMKSLDVLKRTIEVRKANL